MAVENMAHIDVSVNHNIISTKKLHHLIENEEYVEVEATEMSSNAAFLTATRNEMDKTLGFGHTNKDPGTDDVDTDLGTNL